MTLADGTPLTPALGIGAFAEKTLVAAGQATKVDPRARPEAAGLLGCGVMAGLGAAMLTGNVQRGDSVAVFGCGGVGNAAIAGARLAGATRVIAVDVDARKLEWAKDFGATHVVNSRETDPVEAVKSLTAGFGADVCIEAVGRHEVMEQAFYARDLAGTLVQVGVPDPSMRIELPMIEFFGRGGALKPSWYGDCLPSRDFPALIDLYLQGRLDLDRFVTETIGLDEVEDAFHKMERGEVLRSVVVLESSGPARLAPRRLAAEARLPEELLAVHRPDEVASARTLVVGGPEQQDALPLRRRADTRHRHVRRIVVRRLRGALQAVLDGKATILELLGAPDRDRVANRRLTDRLALTRRATRYRERTDDECHQRSHARTVPEHAQPQSARPGRSNHLRCCDATLRVCRNQLAG
jgi:D-arabinose 1-dehydrogenase-like Zn-dependent alcohol dehydrogenase